MTFERTPNISPGSFSPHELGDHWGIAPEHVLAPLPLGITAASWDLPGERTLHIPALPTSRLVVNLKPLRHHTVKTGTLTIHDAPTAPGAIRIAPPAEDCTATVQAAACSFAQIYLPTESLLLTADQLGIASGADLSDPSFNHQDLFVMELAKALLKPAPALLAQQTAVTLLNHLVWNYATARRVNALPPAPTHRWRDVLEYMRLRLADDLTLAELAAIAQLGRHQFCRAFRRHTGSSPWQYLQSLRVTRAQELLRDRRLAIPQVAFLTGYRSLSRFGVIFRRHTGVTPAAYRRSVR